MMGRYEAMLNGINLTSVDPAILITDISYSVPNYDVNGITIAKRHGSRIQAQRKSETSCTITFAIRAYDTAERNRICQQVVFWARDGGELQTSDRDGQKLKCICTAYPTIQSALRWTDSLSITFTAYTLPWWQEVAEQRLILNGTSGNSTLYVPGTAPEAMVEVKVTPTQLITWVHLSVRNRVLSLGGMTIGGGDPIVISYDDNMIQSIKVRGISLLPNRSGVDDLIAVCGKPNSVAFSADGDCQVVFTARGLWD